MERTERRKEQIDQDQSRQEGSKAEGRKDPGAATPGEVEEFLRDFKQASITFGL
jgi:hypothetical protein